ncbi:MAG: metalloprotease TldD [Rickettsiales bacterium]|nr:metalloprotease TldD [Rickettsiales bacterium]|tara:strand:+ start:2016 stop:3437 length:1422 start_codon:yes stop_codon:yes gene_type:complete
MQHLFDTTGLNQQTALSILSDTLHGLDDGELFLEWTSSENFLLDDGRLKNASTDITQGFGMRGVLGEASSYAHSNEFSEAALKRAAETVRAVNYGQSPSQADTHAPLGTNKQLYMQDNPLEAVATKQKIATLRAIDTYLRDKDTRVRQVSASLAGEVQHVTILRADGQMISDIRPLVRLNVSVVVEKDGRLESGSSGAGGRVLYADYLQESNWQRQADEALRQALVNLEARPAPAGEMPVVLGPGWCGVLLHEAVGHGLEGDFNRKGTSTFSGRVGEQVTSKGITIVDNGTIPDRRGSLNVDDEGTPTGETVLIEDGILKGYMQDRMNARLMGVPATGNGRRESYAHRPMPRMTNTYMQAGSHSRDEMIASVKRGLYATHFSGGQVDITSGDFVFNASEAYMIEDGKITTPVKGATLIGNGPVAMQKVRMIGSDMALDEGIGTCGKGGQSVPVGVGQPSLLIDPITVGGTATA